MQKSIKILLFLASIFLFECITIDVHAATVTNNPYVVSYNTITVGSGWQVGGFSSGLNCDKPPSDRYGLFTSCPNSRFYAVNTTLDGGPWTTYWVACTQRPNSLLGSCAHFTNYRSSYNCTYTTGVTSWSACNASGVQYATGYSYNTIAGSSCADQAPTWRSCTPPPPIPAPPSVSLGSCDVTRTSISISWSSPGATYYAIRNDRDANSWNAGACGTLNLGDTCEYTVATSKTFSTTAGNNNIFWVHACNASGCSVGAGSVSHMCTPLECTGTVTTTNATLCGGDAMSLFAPTNYTIVDECGAAKCEYECNAGYEKNGNMCSKTKYSCIEEAGHPKPNNAIPCDSGKSESPDTPWTEVPSWEYCIPTQECGYYLKKYVTTPMEDDANSSAIIEARP